MFQKGFVHAKTDVTPKKKIRLLLTYTCDVTYTRHNPGTQVVLRIIMKQIIFFIAKRGE